MLILAGGRGLRLGGADKALLPLAGRPLLAHVLARLAVPGRLMLVSANGDPGRLSHFGCALIADTIPSHPGPLAGIVAGLEYLVAHHPEADGLVSAPVDTPLLPQDLPERLMAARTASGTVLACAASGGRRHPVAALWPVSLAGPLRRMIVEDGMRRVTDALDHWPCTTVAWDTNPVDPFFNVNTAQDLALASGLLSATLAR